MKELKILLFEQVLCDNMIAIICLHQENLKDVGHRLPTNSIGNRLATPPPITID